MCVVLCHGYDEPVNSHVPKTRKGTPKRVQTTTSSKPVLAANTNAQEGGWKRAPSLCPDEALTLACLPLSVSLAPHPDPLGLITDHEDWARVMKLYRSKANSLPLVDPPQHLEALYILAAWRDGGRSVVEHAEALPTSTLIDDAVGEDCDEDNEHTPQFSGSAWVQAHPKPIIAGEDEKEEQVTIGKGRPKWRIGKSAFLMLNAAHGAYTADPADAEVSEALWTAIYEYAQGQASVQPRLKTLRAKDKAEDMASKFSTMILNKFLEGRYRPEYAFSTWVHSAFANFVSTALHRSNNEDQRNYRFDTDDDHEEDYIPEQRTFLAETLAQSDSVEARAAANVNNFLEALLPSLTPNEHAVLQTMQAGSVDTAEVAALLQRSQQSVRASRRSLKAKCSTLQRNAKMTNKYWADPTFRPGLCVYISR